MRHDERNSRRNAEKAFGFLSASGSVLDEDARQDVAGRLPKLDVRPERVEHQSLSARRIAAPQCLSPGPNVLVGHRES